MQPNNFIIHQKAKQYQWKGECYLSIKTFDNGCARYQVGSREYQLNDKNYLILNDCTHYELTIDEKELVESFCLFFSPSYVSNTYAILKKDNEIDPVESGEQPDLPLMEVCFPRSGPLAQALLKGKLKQRKMTGLELEEYYHQVFMLLMKENQMILEQGNVLTLKKKSTRQELLRRLYYVRDYMEANFNKELSLDELCQVGMLSQNHLIRNFKSLFRASPFQYLAKRKIEYCRQALVSSDKKISAIANEAGYSSLANFSNYFKSITGTSPQQFRNQSQKGDL